MRSSGAMKKIARDRKAKEFGKIRNEQSAKDGENSLDVAERIFSDKLLPLRHPGGALARL